MNILISGYGPATWDIIEPVSLIKYMLLGGRILKRAICARISKPIHATNLQRVPLLITVKPGTSRTYGYGKVQSLSSHPDYEQEVYLMYSSRS